MDKPIKQNKKIAIKCGTSYHFDYISKKVSWSSFFDWVCENIPRGKDVTLELMEHKYEKDGDEVWLDFSWTRKIKNKNFDKQMKKYEKELAKYKKISKE